MTKPEKLSMATPNIVDANVSKIARLFPSCVTQITEDGESKAGIDFDMLRQELSEFVVEGPKERYSFNWPDKRKAILLANTPTTKTLRPVHEESVDFDNTKNIYIEGDNLEALKCLRETYLGKIKMIYIDPPYNTGDDYVYKDDFKESTKEYLKRSDQLDKTGNKLVVNLESNGRFHTDWLNMMYSRIKIARDFLSENGSIFISVDEREVSNLRKICDEIFGEFNYIGSFIWRKKDGGGQAKEYFVIEHEYILVYGKTNKIEWIDQKEKRDIAKYNKSDTHGRFKITKLAKWGNTARREDRPSMYFSLEAPDGSQIYPIAPDGNDGRWRVGRGKMNQLLRDGLIYWEKKKDQWVAYEKEYFNNQTKVNKKRSILYDIAETGDGSNALTELFSLKDTFENPKPVELLMEFLESVVKENDIVLDFFSGSATMAQAVFELNMRANSNIRFILIQIQEKFKEDSASRKLGFDNICQFAEERIRRCGSTIKSLNPKVDIGFRLFRVDESNMHQTYYEPTNISQADLFSLVDNVKQNRTSEDLLIQIMLSLGITLDSSIKCISIAGKEIFDIADGYLIACLDKNITNEILELIARKTPTYIVLRDSCFSSDSVADNFEQIFKTYSPETICKVL